MLTLCNSTTSHATLNAFYHASMLTVHNSLIITCTLVATSMIVQSSECSRYSDPIYVTIPRQGEIAYCIDETIHLLGGCKQNWKENMFTRLKNVMPNLDIWLWSNMGVICSNVKKMQECLHSLWFKEECWLRNMSPPTYTVCFESYQIFSI